VPPLYVPDTGDILGPHFAPQSEHQQAGQRPALGFSPAGCSGKTGLMLYCPLTAQIKGYSFKVATAGQRTRVALSD